MDDEKYTKRKRYLVFFYDSFSGKKLEFVVLAFFPAQAVWSIVSQFVKDDKRDISSKEKREIIYKKYSIKVMEKNYD